MNDFIHRDAWERVALDLVGNDEPLLAIKLLENLPGFYRDNPPFYILNLRKKIEAAIFTAHDYRKGDHDGEVTEERALWAYTNLLRGQLIAEEVKQYNQKKVTPDVVEYGPGEYFVPIGLLHDKRDFAYSYLSMDIRAEDMADKWLSKIPASKGGPRIFVANEIIEHLIDPKELVIEARKHDPDIIHISTPMYCYDPKNVDSVPEKLPHVRTYTPSELFFWCSQQFPDFSGELFTAVTQPMSIRLVRKGAENVGSLRMVPELRTA